MTIQRQYILPNCSLVLEGLSFDPASTELSVLANAECTIVGIDEPLSGGLEFFKSLVEAVNQYSQGLLSGLPHSGKLRTQPTLVEIYPDREGPYHHLQVKAAPGEDAAALVNPPAVKDIKLSTVQLFDLAEAIDQFASDSQTLPELKLDLTPLSRRYVKPSEPLAQRATPPLLGVGALVIAAIGCFLLPIPELQKVDPTSENSTPEAVTPSSENTAPSPEQTTEPAAETEATENTAASEATTAENTENPDTLPVIQDEAQIAALQAQLTEQLEAAIPSGTTFPEALIYRVSVADNGDIIGYRHENNAALTNADETPLPGLTYIPVEGTSSGAEQVAQYRVTFTPSGTVDVSPWTADAAESDSETSSLEPATDSDRVTSPVSDRAIDTLSASIENELDSQAEISDLNTQLRQAIVSQQTQAVAEKAVSYRVRMAANGRVVGYEAENDLSAQLADQTVLPDLVESGNDSSPQVDFRVVMQPSGVVEVSPWRGWR